LIKIERPRPRDRIAPTACGRKWAADRPKWGKPQGGDAAAGEPIAPRVMMGDKGFRNEARQVVSRACPTWPKWIVMGDITIDMIDTTRNEGHEGMMSRREEGD
jgi:hypothetical protein